MTSSDFGMTAHNSALLKKFQGNGWAVSCSPESQKELSAILEDAVSAPEDDAKPSEPLPIYKSDWAALVFTRSEGWRAEDGFAPLWLKKATDGAKCALFQLPAPDHRWVVKFDGKILIPFDYRKAGWRELHEIMVHGFLLDRTELFVGAPQENKTGPSLTTLADLRKAGGDLLRSTEMIPQIQAKDRKRESVLGRGVLQLDWRTASRSQHANGSRQDHTGSLEELQRRFQ